MNPNPLGLGWPPQLVQVVSNEANRSAFGFPDKQGPLQQHKNNNVYGMYHCSTQTWPRTKRPFRQPKAIRSSHSSFRL